MLTEKTYCGPWQADGQTGRKQCDLNSHSQSIKLRLKVSSRMTGAALVVNDDNDAAIRRTYLEVFVPVD